MIFQVTIGEGVRVTLDDELEERPTPEHCRDYLKAAGDEALRVYGELPAVVEADASE